MMQKNTWLKNGDNTFSLKFRKIFPKPLSNDWNKLSVETVEQTTIFKIEVDHKEITYHSVLLEQRIGHTKAEDPVKSYTAIWLICLELIFHLLWFRRSTNITLCSMVVRRPRAKEN